MPYDLPLPPALVKARWKVKIFDFERLENPHVTILWKYKKWRLCLRTGRFLEGQSRWKDIPETLREIIEENWETLCNRWDELHQTNPVAGEVENDG